MGRIKKELEGMRAEIDCLRAELEASNIVKESDLDYIRKMTKVVNQLRAAIDEHRGEKWGGRVPDNDLDKELYAVLGKAYL